MKYLLIILAVIALVRIDVILRMVDRLSGRFKSKPEEIQVSDISGNREIVSIGEDQNLRQSPKSVFLSLLKDFHDQPKAEIRERAITELRAHPSIFTTTLDRELEGLVYSWRDLLQQKNKETSFFLSDLSDNLRGENREMIKRVFSLLLDHDLKEFMLVYPRSKDPQCSISTVLGDQIPEEEKLNEFYDRREKLLAYVAQEKLDPELLAYGKICQLTLGLLIEKIAPDTEPSPPEPEETQQ